MGTFTNSEDPDEMLHNAAFHQGHHKWERSGSVEECLTDGTEGPRVQASPASLRCVLEQEH